MVIPSGRAAIAKSVLAVIVVLVVVVVAAAAVLTRSSATTSTSSAVISAPSTTSSSSSSPGLDITHMYSDVSGGFQPPSVNTTFINNNQTTYVASAGVSFTLTVDLEYSNCAGSSCPSQVSSVSVTPVSFTVYEVNAGLGVPVSCAPGTAANSDDCTYSVTITAPSTSYTGPLTVTSALG